MKQNGNSLEIDNIALLIRASYNPDILPHPQTNDQTYKLVLTHLQRRFSDVEFPDTAVGILGFILIVLAFYIGYQLISNTSFHANPSLVVLLLWLALNLLIVPAAGAVIVIRRQHG